MVRSSKDAQLLLSDHIFERQDPTSEEENSAVFLEGGLRFLGKFQAFGGCEQRGMPWMISAMVVALKR